MLRGKTAYSHRILKILLNKRREVYPRLKQKCPWVSRASDRLSLFSWTQFQKILKSIDTKLVLTWPRPVRTNCVKTTLINSALHTNHNTKEPKEAKYSFVFRHLGTIHKQWNSDRWYRPLVAANFSAWTPYWPHWSHDDFHQLLKQLPSTTCFVSKKNGKVKCTPRIQFSTWCFTNRKSQ